MQHVDIYQQQNRNNTKSILLLLGFPSLIMASIWAFFYFFTSGNIYATNDIFISLFPGTIITISIWFIIAYVSNTYMIRSATNAKPLSREDNNRVFNLVEKLCISQGMPMPKINIIESSALNAFASGIDQKSYTVTLTRGIMETLNDEELEAVLAHELMHIKNHDVRLLIISIIFVGIFSFVMQSALRMLFYGRRSQRNRKDSGKAILLILAISAVAYLISLIFKFALSRNREYMADAGAAEMTQKPLALASALRKISGNSNLENVQGDVQQLFIEHESFFDSSTVLSSLFSTHPPIQKRIEMLEKF
jgi:heat shock protein HtpX